MDRGVARVHQAGDGSLLTRVVVGSRPDGSTGSPTISIGSQDASFTTSSSGVMETVGLEPLMSIPIVAPDVLRSNSTEFVDGVTAAAATASWRDGEVRNRYRPTGRDSVPTSQCDANPRRLDPAPPEREPVAGPPRGDFYGLQVLVLRVARPDRERPIRHPQVASTHAHVSRMSIARARRIVGSIRASFARLSTSSCRASLSAMYAQLRRTASARNR